MGMEMDGVLPRPPEYGVPGAERGVEVPLAPPD